MKCFNSGLETIFPDISKKEEVAIRCSFIEEKAKSCCLSAGQKLKSDRFDISEV